MRNQRSAAPLALALVLGLPSACDDHGERDRGADPRSTTEDATSTTTTTPDAADDATPFVPETPDQPVIPTPPAGATTDPEEVGTQPCIFSYGAWMCRLNMDGPGHLVVDLGEGRRGYMRTLRATWGGSLVLATDAGHPILVLPPGSAGVTTVPAPLHIPMGAPGRATTAILLVLNLDTNSPLDGTGTFETQVTVFDSLGNQHQLDVTFTRQSDGSWSWEATSPQGEIEGSGDWTPAVVATGTLTFDTDGNLVTDTQTTRNVTYFGAAPQDLNLDFGDPAFPAYASTGNAGNSAVSFVEQDGYAPGTLAFLEVTWFGQLEATYTNGQERPLGSLAVALFDAPMALHAIAQHLWIATAASGSARVDAPDVGGRGGVRGYTLVTPWPR